MGSQVGRNEGAELEGENKRGGERKNKRGGGLGGWGGGGVGWGAGAGRLRYFMHLLPHSMGPETSLVGSPPPWSISANICVCTRRYAGMHM
jgi:hypothetical protein